MSVANQISRIQNLVSELRTNIINKGVQLASDADLEACVDAVPNISGGGGPTPSGYELEYFTITNESAQVPCNVVLNHNQTSTNYRTNVTVNLDYSFDKVTWTNVSQTSVNNVTVCSIPAGGSVYIRSNLRDVQVKTYSNKDYYNCKYFSFNTGVILSGNIMSLLYGDDFVGKNVVQDRELWYLFYGQNKISDISNLIINVDFIGSYGCADMFNSCTGITSGIASLPAKTVCSYGCYKMFTGAKFTTPPVMNCTSVGIRAFDEMFANCQEMTTAPSLPATTLADYCYYGMFFNCKALTNAPELPALTLRSNCYYYLFNGCTNLNYIKCLATDISATNCVNSWVTNVGASGTFVKNANMSSWPSGANGIPNGWTVSDAV